MMFDVSSLTVASFSTTSDGVFRSGLVARTKRATTGLSVALSLVLASALPLLGFAPSASAQSVTVGANLDIDFNVEVAVPFSGFAGVYFLNLDLIHDPGAGPMFKNFDSPIDDASQPILLDASQPNPLVIFETFTLNASSVPITGWYEAIVPEGFEWLIPDDTAIPGPFPAGQSLIEVDGAPHPWEFVPQPAVVGLDQLAVSFPPVHPGQTLGITKPLLWVGTPDNTIWGDHQLDQGDAFDESVIRVWEYPVPEPATAATIFLAGTLVLTRRRWR